MRHGSNRKSAPDFLIIGAMKCGTTTLYDLLASHPDFALPALKEPRLLRPEWSDGKIRQEYSLHFGQSDGICGEASTYYAMMPHFPDVSRLGARIMNRDGQIIYIVRDPIERIRSHLLHDVSVGRLSPDFGIGEVLTRDSRYIAWSHYTRQLAPWISAFGDERCTIVDFTQLTAHQGKVLSRLCAILGAADVKHDSGVHSNAQDELVARLDNPFAEALRRNRLYRKFLKPVLGGRVTRSLKRLLYRRTQRAELDEQRYERLKRHPLMQELQEDYAEILRHPSMIWS